jgi:hypothetical protein
MEGVLDLHVGLESSLALFFLQQGNFRMIYPNHGPRVGQQDKKRITRKEASQSRLVDQPNSARPRSVESGTEPASHVEGGKID